MVEEEKKEDDDDEERRRREAEEEERRRREAEEAALRDAQANQNQFDINLLQMKGIKVTVVGLKDYTTLNKFRITGALMDGNQVIIDENAKACAFTTKYKGFSKRPKSIVPSGLFIFIAYHDAI